METKVFNYLPEEAKKIRKEVFVEEQGFENEFDDIDNISVHLVTYDKDKPVATCRIYYNEEKKAYTVGRIAVVKAYRGKKIGAEILQESIIQTEALGGKALYLHAQCRATEFYEKQGFEKIGAIDFDENCPHIWMYKEL